jgi:hypothetical protein
MRRSRLLLYFALALSGLVYSASNAWARGAPSNCLCTPTQRSSCGEGQ